MIFRTTYADLTRNDPNLIKRFLQRRRLRDALDILDRNLPVRSVVDFGAADGEFCKLLVERFPCAAVVCYEPAPLWRAEAETNLKGFNIKIVSHTEELQNEHFDAVFCMEVLEHLPEAQTEIALNELHRILRPGGLAVISVPIEVGLPALLKGAFRMTRSLGGFDTTPINVFRAFLGIPPRERPVDEVALGILYHHEHMGFDHRNLSNMIKLHFHLLRTQGSPIRWLGALLNTSIYFLAKKTLCEERTAR